MQQALEGGGFGLFFSWPRSEILAPLFLMYLPSFFFLTPFGNPEAVVSLLMHLHSDVYIDSTELFAD